MIHWRFTGDLVSDMETAKALIGRPDQVDIPSLISIATNTFLLPSARIAAIYTLGFTDDSYISGDSLVHILSDEANNPEVRAYAAEGRPDLLARRREMMLARWAGVAV